jgi:hypothetical protein
MPGSNQNQGGQPSPPTGTQTSPQTTPVQAQPPSVTTVAEPGSRLQWFRESMTAAISIVILGLAAITLYGTWNSAKLVPADDKTAAAQKESYERQKDIMLYALALLGTVTGYYLGRVPAELHAQQAQKAADTAQQQLQSTQDRLTDTASTAATAATQLSGAQAEKEKAQNKVQEAKVALANVSKSIGQKLTEAEEGRKATLGLDDAVSPVNRGSEEMKQVKDEIDNLLNRIGN